MLRINNSTKIELLERSLQRQGLWIKVFAFVWMLTIGLGVFFIINWNVNADENKLKLRQLSIIDENGTPRMVLGSPNPNPQIRGKRYKRRNPSTGIQFNDENGDEIGGLGSLDDGTINLCFDVIPGKGVPHERVCMFYSPDGKTGIVVNDDGGIERAKFGITSSKGTAEMVLKDFEGNARLRFGVEPDGTPKFEMFDKDGKSIKNDLTEQTPKQKK